ncbi:MAG: hypothetical protein Q4G23_00970 [Clostridia bacterium]|nr:hypothetical protein [Clostridia bacterium]
MRKKGKILTSLLCIIMFVMTMNVFATEDIIIDEEITVTDELTEIEEEVELLSEDAVCYIGDSAEAGTTFTSLKAAIESLGSCNRTTIHLLCDTTWDSMTISGEEDFAIDGTNPGSENFTVTLLGNVTIKAYSTRGYFTNVTVDLNKYHFVIGGNGELHLEAGSVLTNGYDSSNGGGAAFVEASTVYMYEGSIVENCEAEGNGGAFRLNGAKGFNMQGGTIRNCISGDKGGAIAAVGSGSKVTLTGGTIEGNTAVKGGGGVYADSASTVNASGSINISGNTLSDETTVNNFEVAAANSLVVPGNVTGNIGLTFTGATKGTVLGTAGEGVTDVSKILYDNEDYKVTLSGGSLILAPDYVCYLGDDEATGTKYKTLGEALSSKTGSSVTIRLISDVELEAMDVRNDTDFKIIGDNGDGENFTVKLLGDVNIRDYSNHGTLENVTFNLNGYHISTLGSLSLTLNDGAILENGYGSNGGAIFAQSGTVNLNEGSMIRNCNGKNGGAIFLNAATLNVNGGQITGCSATVGGGAITVNSNSSGTIVLNGGTITGNKAPLGGAIYLQPTSTDVVKVSGSVNVTGNTLTDGTTENNIQITESSELDVTGTVTGAVGVTITGAVNGAEAGIVSGANVTDISKITYDDELFTLTLKDGKLILTGDYVCYVGADEASGTKYKTFKEAYVASADKNVTIVLVKDTTWDAGTYNNGADFVVSGKNSGDNYTLKLLGDITVSGYSNRCYFENVTVDLNNYHFTLAAQGEMTLRSGAVLENGYTTAGGGAVYVGNACTFTMEDGSLIKNCSAKEGGAIRLNASKMNMTGGEITNCTSENFGGAVAVAYDATFNMTGGTISGNKSAKGAGIMTGAHDKDVSVTNISGDVTVTGNTLSDGTTKNNIQIYLVSNLNIANAVTGNIGLTFDGATEGATVAVIASGVTFTDTDNVFYDNDSYIVYPDGTEVKLAVKPSLNVQADSGVYTDGSGVIRFLTTFEGVSGASVEKYGTYALATDTFDVATDSSSLSKFADFTVTPEAGKSYIVDIVEIPATKLDALVMGVSFVKIKGIETPFYVPYVKSVSVNNANATVKNLGDKVSE